MQYATNVLALFERYGDIDIQYYVTGEGVHDLRNVLTLCATAHGEFDRMEVCFVQTAVVSQDTYFTCIHC